VGIHIHNLLDQTRRQSVKGANPFAGLTYKQRPFAETVECYDPPYSLSTAVYKDIANKLP